MQSTPVAERSNEVERQVSDTSNSPYRPDPVIHCVGSAMSGFEVQQPTIQHAQFLRFRDARAVAKGRNSVSGESGRVMKP